MTPLDLRNKALARQKGVADGTPHRRLAGSDKPDDFSQKPRRDRRAEAYHLRLQAPTPSPPVPSPTLDPEDTRS